MKVDKIKGDIEGMKTVLHYVTADTGEGLDSLVRRNAFL